MIDIKSLLFVGVAIAFSGCADLSWKPPATASKQIGGPSGPVVYFTTRNLSSETFAIGAFGPASLTDDQYVAEWNWMADQLAHGRKYSKFTQIEPWRHEGLSSNQGPGVPQSGIKVTGQITLL